MIEEKIEVSESIFERIIINFCYDRTICREAGADYVRMNSDDIKKIKEYALNYYTIKKTETEDGQAVESS